jgi:hypothetical protein
MPTAGASALASSMYMPTAISHRFTRQEAIHEPFRCRGYSWPCLSADPLSAVGNGFKPGRLLVFSSVDSLIPDFALGWGAFRVEPPYGLTLYVGRRAWSL